MKSLDVSQLDSTNSLVPNAGEQDNTSSSNPLHFLALIQISQEVIKPLLLAII